MCTHALEQGDFLCCFCGEQTAIHEGRIQFITYECFCAAQGSSDMLSAFERSGIPIKTDASQFSLPPEAEEGAPAGLIAIGSALELVRISIPEGRIRPRPLPLLSSCSQG